MEDGKDGGAYHLSGAVNCDFFTIGFFYLSIYPGIIWILDPDMRPYSYFGWSSLRINHIIITTQSKQREQQIEMNF